VGVLVGIALIMTLGVYGLVAGIVKLDDAGLHLSRRPGPGGALPRALGTGILALSPWLMRFLSVAGTAAMFLVGGGILVHGIPPLHHWAEGFAQAGGVAGTLGPSLVSAAVGVAAGGVIVGVVTLVGRMRRAGAAKA
jgi:predicted DNA repair protein MutK